MVPQIMEDIAKALQFKHLLAAEVKEELVAGSQVLPEKL